MRLKHWFYTIPLRLRSLFHRAQVEQELDEELRYHLDRQIEENIARGMTEDQARSAALRAIGGVERRKEECRDMRRVRLIEDLMQDVRYGLRTLRKSPGFTAVAVLSLALGIGANTAIFSVFDPIVIKSLPVKDPEQLVVLNTFDPRSPDEGFTFPFFPYAMFEQLRARMQVFSGALTIQNLGGDGFVDMVGPETGNRTERANLQLVSGEYFQVLGVNAIAGRTLSTADDQAAGAHPVAVLSYRFWQRRFAGDLSVIGKVITLKQQPLTIIGVTSPGFIGTALGEAPDIWTPMGMINIWGRGLSNINTRIMARLRPGVRKEQAQAALNLFLAQIKSEPSDLGKQMSRVSEIRLSPGRQGFAGARTWLSRPFRILMAAVGLVLLIACANVANLLLARAARRAPEVAIRLTIGAGRFRLIRQFLTESALLAAAGAILGLFLAWCGSRVILVLLSEYDTSITIGIGEISGARVLGFTIAASLLTTLLFGLTPALIATRQNLNTALKAPATPRSRISLSRILVIAQVSLSLLLLTGAGLVVRTLHNLRTRDLGFAAEQIIYGWINPREIGLKPEQIRDLNRRILERLNATPGVRSATMEGLWGTGRKSWACCITVEGYDHRSDEDRQILTKHVSSGYFRAIGLPLLLGREFTPQEIIRQPEKFARVAILNESMARRYFGTENPLGRRFGWGDSASVTAERLRWDRFDRGDPGQFEIVGVAKDAVYDSPRGKTGPLIYFPGQDAGIFVVRTAGPAAPLAATIRREIQSVDENLALDIYAYTQWLDSYLIEERLLAKIATFFSLLALLLASIGLYGVMSYDVARRTHEIGIRMALGAQRRDVVGLVMRETMVLVVIGAIIGLSTALGTTRFIESRLYGLKSNDPLTIALATLLLIGVAALAGYLPARRAARVDPLMALRHD
jgi:predicted permease